MMGHTMRKLLVVVVVLLCACASGPARPTGRPPADPLATIPAAELYQRGTVLARTGDHVRAEQYIAAAIARGYPERRALPVLLRVCLASSRLHAALRYATPYLQRHPDAWSLRLLVASIDYALGEVEAARREVDLVIEAAPEAAAAHYLRAVILRDRVGDRPGATASFTRYLELDPDGEHAAEARGYLAGLEGPSK